MLYTCIFNVYGECSQPTCITEDLYLVGDGDVDSSCSALFKLKTNEPQGHLLRAAVGQVGE